MKHLGSLLSCAKFVSISMSIAFAMLFATSAQAQITLGGNESDFKRKLRSLGYNRIETQKIGISNSRFHACKGDKRYRIRFDWTGNRKVKVIGKCRIRINEAQAIEKLKAEGYQRINIEDHSGKYVAIACLNSNKLRVVMNYFGDVRGKRKIGRCVADATPEDITARLKQQGYSRIRFTDRLPPDYTVIACLDGRKSQLFINRRGEIVERTRKGSCARAMDSNQLISSLEERGLTRVIITDDQLPRYHAEACRGANRVEVALNRWGEIRNEVRIGNCRQAYTGAELRRIMVEGGITSVNVIKNPTGFLVKGCTDGRYREYSINKYGEILSQKERGSCTSLLINELAEKMRSRGMSGLEFYVEGCRNGQKVRIGFDEFANRTSRNNIGTCQ